MTDMQTRTAAWHEIVLDTLKSNRVKLVPYVPDRVFTPLIQTITLGKDTPEDAAKQANDQLSSLLQ